MIHQRRNLRNGTYILNFFITSQHSLVRPSKTCLATFALDRTHSPPPTRWSTSPFWLSRAVASMDVTKRYRQHDDMPLPIRTPTVHIRRLRNFPKSRSYRNQALCASSGSALISIWTRWTAFEWAQHVVAQHSALLEPRWQPSYFNAQFRTADRLVSGHQQTRGVAEVRR